MATQRKPTPIKNILTDTIKNIISEKEDSVYREDINKAWEEAVGKAASRHSTPAQIKRNTLIINVDSPIWIYQLNIKKEEVEKKLNKLLGRKEPLKIRLRAGED